MDATTQPSNDRPPTSPQTATVLDARARLAPRRTTALRTYLQSGSFLPESLVRHSRSAAIAQIVSGAAAALPLEGLALIADAGLLLFAIDDLLDESDLSDAEVSLRVVQYATTGLGISCPEVAFDPIARGITTLRERLLARPLGPALVDEWGRSLERMLVAMLEERRASETWRRCGTLPTLPQYLATGQDSIGVEMVAWVAWIAMSEGSLSQLTRLRWITGRYAMAVRVANDLRSCERERDEGKLNALVIAGEAARNQLERLVERALEEGVALLARDHLAETESARFLDAFARGLVGLYETRDFHTAEVPAGAP